jgi:hypothetical protein
LQSATQASSEPTEAERDRVGELSRRAADFIERHRFVDAERTLGDALALNPNDTTCLYDLACVHAATGRADEAIADLERATKSGFTDFSLLQRNPAFAELRHLPRYARLLARKEQIVHHTAERILGELKTQFGDRYSYVVDEPDKLVFAAYTEPAALDDLVKQIRLERTSQGAQIFSHPSDEFIRIIVVSAADFSRIERRSGVAGYYDDSTRTLIVKHAGPELWHEFTHAMHAADQHALDQEHPVWLSEGLATLYEYAPTENVGDIRTPVLVPADTWRLANVQAAAKHNAMIPIEKLVTLDRASFTARADLAYGEAGSLLLYLYEHQLLKKFYDAYTTGYSNDSSGIVALKAVTGVDSNDLQKEWMEWFMARPVPRK